MWGRKRTNKVANKVRKCTMKFTYLILTKIVKIVATRGQILRRKCTKFDFGWGAYTSLPQRAQTPSWILGALLLREREGNGGEERGG